MTKRAVLSMLVVALPLSLAAQELSNPAPTDSDAATHTTARSAPRTYLNLAFDADLTMRAGAENLLLVHHGLTRLEDVYIGNRWFPEDAPLPKAGGVLARIAKYAFLDLPMDYFPSIVAHEYFGHGSRYRELDIQNIDYGFDWPIPYGSGGGHASTSIEVPITYHELIGILVGGVEAHPMINRNLAMRWMARNEVHYREAGLYFWTFRVAFDYTRDAEEAFRSGDNNDITVVVELWNEQFGRTNPDSLLMTVDDLQKRHLISLVNPLVFYSMWVRFKVNVWDGNTSAAMPTIRLGPVRYMPNFDLSLTPFGPQYHMENYLGVGGAVSVIDFRLGDQTFYDGWWGIGLFGQNLYENRGFSLDAHFDLWNQPKLTLGDRPDEPDEKALGAAFSVRGHYDVPDMEFPLAIMVELGYKSDGFLQGYHMDASQIVMFGVGIRN